ncbi:MAG TPA: hypothetical protein VFV37_05035 [Luteibaculaceae bacterium]|nr:hypothetical protein [Luteibaculaceae bacterium]
MEERFAYGEINNKTYEKFSTKLKEERRSIRSKMEEVDFELSNPQEFFEYAVNVSRNLQQIWATEDYSIKSELQNLLFPEGIVYDRENDTYRTPKSNSIFSVILQVARVAEEAEKEKSIISDRLSNWVGPPGLEPGTT